MYGIYSSLGAVLSNLIIPYGFNTVHCAIIGICYIIMGIVTAVILALRIDKTKAYLSSYKAVCFTSLLGGLMLLAILPIGNFGLLLPITTIMGMSLIPINSIGISFVVELTHPVSEAMSTGMMMMSSQFFGIVTTYLATLSAEASPLYTVGMYSTLGLITNILNNFIV